MTHRPQQPGTGTQAHTQGTPATARTRDGRELHYVTRTPSDVPEDAPTVVFEAGMAATRSWWALVQPKVPARTVAYDRSGLGRSPADTGPRTLERMAADLGDLLDHLGTGPYILVAHSGGGPIVRAAAAADPDRIAGLVLVEATDETCDALFDPWFRRMERAGQAGTMLLARLGLLGRLYRGVVAALPDDVAADMRAEAFTVAAARTRGAELRGLVDAMNRLRARPLDLPPRLPVTTISGALADSGMNMRMRRAANISHRTAQAAPTTAATSWPAIRATWSRSPNPAWSPPRSNASWTRIRPREVRSFDRDVLPLTRRAAALSGRFLRAARHRGPRRASRRRVGGWD
ncbi:alpha/beta fold hydrolase [Actinomadura nitritigenes]|uniref:alpha/beta fold hydrolase n=1 Tax=Actinomadura nitritigenes TaxID=134602 RepID=UPI003D945C50